MDSTLPMKPSDRPSSRPSSEAPTLRRKPKRRGSMTPLTDGLSGLGSTEASDRIAAAKKLKDSVDPERYENLVEGLVAESDHEVQMAILDALAEIGGQNADRKIVSEVGFEPVKAFVLEHIEDGESVEAGLKALQWTCNINDLIGVVDIVRTSTENDSESNTVATRFLGSILTER